jgi:hypothetical protein
LVLGITEKLGASGRGERRKPKKEERELTEGKAFCFFSLGGKKRSRECRQVFEGEGREEEVKEVRAPPWMESFGRRVWPIPSDIITISSLHTPPRT